MRYHFILVSLLVIQSVDCEIEIVSNQRINNGTSDDSAFPVMVKVQGGTVNIDSDTNKSSLQDLLQAFNATLNEDESSNCQLGRTVRSTYEMYGSRYNRPKDVRGSNRLNRLSKGEREGQDLYFDKMRRRGEGCGNSYSSLNQNFINRLRYGKKPEPIIDAARFNVEPKQQFPINDDVADFAGYMKSMKNQLRRGHYSRGHKFGPKRVKLIDDDVSNKEDTDGLTDDNIKGDETLKGDLRDNHLHRKYNDDENDSRDRLANNDSKFTAFDKSGANLASLRRDYNSPYNGFSLTPQLRGHRNIIDNDNIMWDQNNNEMESSLLNNIDGNFDYLDGNKAIERMIENEIINEAENTAISTSRKRSDEWENTEFVKDKLVQLSEPFAFNKTHLVSSFLYSMIPFKSPLLNLLEADKHSKYMMIKVDPVLQKSQRASYLIDLVTNSTDSLFIRNIARLINKSIRSETMSDENLFTNRAKCKNDIYKSKYNSKFQNSNLLNKQDKNSIQVLQEIKSVTDTQK